MPLILQPTQWDCVRVALIEYLAVVPSIRTVLEPLLPPDVLACVSDQPPQAWAEWTISVLKAEGFSRDIPQDNPSVVKVLRQFATQPEMAALLRIVQLQLEDHRRETVAAEQDAVARDPFRPIIMRRRQPLLARAQAGSALKALLRTDDAAAYVVHGPESKSGCSYTAEIVGYAIATLGLNRRADIQMASVEYSDEMVERHEAVSMIATSLVEQIDTRQKLRRQPVTQLPPPFEESDKWLHAIAQWLISAAANTGEAWWLLIDRLPPVTEPIEATPPNDDAVDRFIQILVRKLARLSSANQTRLVILSYQYDFPAEIGVAIVREELPRPSTIGQAEIEELFRGYFASRGGADTEAITTAAGMVLSTMPPSGHYLPNLNKSIRDVFRRLAGDTP